MTVSTPASSTPTPVIETVTLTIDGIEMKVPKGTLIIRAAEQMGTEIPRFCDHPLLGPVANCRACLIEIEGLPKPQPACATPVADKMVVKTQLTSTVADIAQRGVMEFLLINHPLDCPVCDKGGECPLQNQSMTHGNGESRFDGVKRTFPKPIAVSSQILLDRERCVSCARCTRFADEIAGDPLIELFERGAQQQVGIAEDTPFDSYFSGNTVQICPVGALTSTDYRFRARPFDLVSTPTTCEHCASGCALRTDDRRGKVMRRLAWDDADVNEEWNCDKGRFAFTYLNTDRLTNPLIREDGALRVASWPEAIALVAAKLDEHRGRTGVLPGGRLTREDAYAYGKFARVALGSDDIDFRARPTSDEEHQLLASLVAGSGLGVSYADLESAPIVLLVGLEPEEESPIIFLRLRKGVQAGTTKVAAVSSWASPGLVKTGGVVLAAAPGGEAQLLAALKDGAGSLSAEASEVADALREPGAIVLVGERLGLQHGGISAAVALAGETGAALAWVPRRAGERGALDAGALNGLLPGGRPIGDDSARAEVAQAWGIDASQLPTEAGLSFAGIIDALRTIDDEPADDQPPLGADSDTYVDDGVETIETDGEVEAVTLTADPTEVAALEAGADADDEEPTPRISALVVGGVEISDLPRPDEFRQALMEAEFVLSLETRLSAVDAYADVVLPVAVDTERIGSYVDWEGRIRFFNKAMKDTRPLSDGRVLAMIAEEMDRPIGHGEPASLRRELESLRPFEGVRASVPTVSAPVEQRPAGGKAVLASWRHLLDLGILQAGELYLAGTRRRPVARLSASTAASVPINDGDLLSVSTADGVVTLPLVITDMPDGVVWIPGNSPGSTVNESLGVTAGAIVDISRGGTQ
ncbi:MAG: NADH-quinone oxidoreductase subunit G [Candidatus Nanopelagicales bacterium]